MPSWIPKQEFSNIGFIPMFPVPNGVNETSTMMGGWEFGIPKTSTHKDLAWELIKIILEPEVLSPWIATQGFIPTRISMGQGPGRATEQLRKSIPFFDEMVSMIPRGQARPSIAEYATIAQHIRQAINEVTYGLKDPNQDFAGCRSKVCKVFGMVVDILDMW